MSFWTRSKSAPSRADRKQLDAVNARRSALAQAPAEALCRTATCVEGAIAAAAVASERVLGQRPFDVQILGALAMAAGKIAEMQTGEGKTLAAALAVPWLARSVGSCHVLTANDYLARRDAEWMSGIYRALGLTVGAIGQQSGTEERRRAYACDITYATANEAGFDYLRDGLALRSEDFIQRPFAAALIDEADSILIDEARIPLVIAGGEAPPQRLAMRVAVVAREFVCGRDYALDERARNVFLTDAGIARAESALGCPNLYDPTHSHVLTALQNALHAAVLLRRDVDYLIRDGRIELIDECKGRIAENRRWPDGLQTAIEAREGLILQAQGGVLGSITLQNFVRLYPRICGMTGTAATQAAELRDFYGLEVVAIPTNRPVIRIDHPDRIFATRREKDDAVVSEIVEAHQTGRPVLVGTASVAESEQLSARLVEAGVPHEVLNARDDEREARIVARAGAHGAVTVSTNMAGRGTDIPLEGDRVRELGGLYVIGTNRHESRRIDRQLRGRAGRQGDPGSSRFFVSPEDDLLQRYGIADLLTGDSPADAIETAQRIIEEESLEVRHMLEKYEHLIEQQRRILYEQRREDVEQGAPVAELIRIDGLWADHLAYVTELRNGTVWLALAGKDPLPSFLQSARELFERLLTDLEEPAEVERSIPAQRGATWTYVIKDQPFGNLTDRLCAGLRRRLREIIG